MAKSISVVIPVYNEEDNIVEMYQELRDVLQRITDEYEIVVVDDGSSDRTVERLLRAGRGDDKLILVELRRNFGQTAAMAAGLDVARKDVIVTMDGDLQNDPSSIPAMLSKLEEGYDMVAGWRKDRKDALVSRKLPSVIANWLISAVTKVRLHDYGCTLKAFTNDIAKGIRLYGETHRFIPALAAEYGARIYEMPVGHRPRKAGKSKYGITRTIRVLLDLVTIKFLLGYSKRPIHLFGLAGIVSGGLGAGILLYLAYGKLFQGFALSNRPLLILGVMLVIIGLQFICFGLIAEVQARIYYESQGKPVYRIRRCYRGGEETDLQIVDEGAIGLKKIAN